jgi:hypothetical protein
MWFFLVKGKNKNKKYAGFRTFLSEIFDPVGYLEMHF